MCSISCPALGAGAVNVSTWHVPVPEQVSPNSLEEGVSAGLPVVVLFLMGFLPSRWRCPGTALARMGRGRGEGGAGSRVDAAGAGHALRVCAGARDKHRLCLSLKRASEAPRYQC